MTHLLEALAQASARPSQLRFVTAAGVHVTSFAQLWSRACAVAGALRGRSPAPVAGLLTASESALACLVGVLLSGRDFVSLPLPGRAQPPADHAASLARLLALCGADSMVVEPEHMAACRGLSQHWSGELVMAARCGGGEPSSGLGSPPPGSLIQFSSGTTGVPKGVVLSGSAILASVRATLDRLDVRAGDVSCQWVPLSHDMGLIGLFSAWCAGWDGRLGTTPFRHTCMAPELFVLRPLRWLTECARERATLTTGPTFAYQVASRQLPRARLQLDLSSLRACVVGAEPIGAEALTDFARAAAPHGFDGRALCPAYGLSEATLAVSLVSPASDWSARDFSVAGRTRTLVSCGPPLDNIELQATPRGAGDGPLRIRGPAVSRGFMPARTREPDEWLDTGDRGILCDGQLYLTGRSDDQLCLAGRNVFAWEIEHAVQSVAGLRAGGCAVVPDAQGRYVVLFEAGRSSPKADLAQVVCQVRTRAACAFDLGPSAVAAVARGTLPKTPSGKLRRVLIARQLPSYLDGALALVRW